MRDNQINFPAICIERKFQAGLQGKLFESSHKYMVDLQNNSKPESF